MENKIIWSDMQIDYSKWDKFLKEDCKYYDRLNDKEKENLIERYLSETLLYSQHILDHFLDNQILVLSDLNFLGNHKIAAANLSSNNVKDCLVKDRGCKSAMWYVDEENEFCSKQKGSAFEAHYTFRKYKKNLKREDLDEFLDAILFCETKEKINKLLDKITVPFGNTVKQIYGI